MVFYVGRPRNPSLPSSDLFGNSWGQTSPHILQPDSMDSSQINTLKTKKIIVLYIMKITDNIVMHRVKKSALKIATTLKLTFMSATFIWYE